MGKPLLAHILGQGPQGPLRSCDIYKETGQASSLRLTPRGPRPRMCHAITDLGPGGYLLTGGRMSPADGLQDSWLFRKDANEWARTHDLPSPIYRHSTVRLGDSYLTLLAGGKTGVSQLSDKILLRHPVRGWVACAVSSPFRPIPVFGAVLVCTGQSGGNDSDGRGRIVFQGLLCGGMMGDGTVARQVVQWQLDVTDLEVYVVVGRLAGEEC